MTKDAARPQLVPALERGTRILDFVARSKASVSLSEIARDIGIAKSSAHLLCNTLVQLELLIRRPDQTFRLGPHVMRWSNAFIQQSDVAAEFASIWDHETDLPGATITLSVLQEDQVVYIAARNSGSLSTTVDFCVGMRLPAAFTATGKSFLSHMADFEVRRLFATGLPAPRTPKSVRSIDQLLSELHQIRRDGYSCDDEQVAEGMVCYGASVLDSRNRPIAGVAVSLPPKNFSTAERNNIINNLKGIASRLSRRMGADLESEVVK
jgi:DNA-binding IclR family transcriptional regulator